MLKKINDVSLRDIQTRQEKLLFSYIVQIAEETGFGNVELSLTIKNGKVVNIKNTKIIDNFNIGNE